MFSLPTLATLVAAASLAHAHNTFVRIAHNGVWQRPLQYIRNNTAPYNETGAGSEMNPIIWAYPVYSNASVESVRCGRDNMAWAGATETLQVKPGDTIEFLVLTPALYPNSWDDPDRVQWDNCPGDKGVCTNDTSEMGPVNLIVHEGPVMMHLSRAPAGQDLRTYDGSGEWVKIYTLGIEIRKELANPVFWLPHNDGKEAPRFISTIPKQTPAGKYLVRVDQVYYGNSQYNTAPQLFPACAQIEVVSDTTGDLPKGIKIPENLQMDQPGMTSKYEDLPNKYTYPGGPLWDGETLVQDYPPHWDR